MICLIIEQTICGIVSVLPFSNLKCDYWWVNKVVNCLIEFIDRDENKANVYRTSTPTGRSTHVILWCPQWKSFDFFYVVGHTYGHLENSSLYSDLLELSLYSGLLEGGGQAGHHSLLSLVVDSRTYTDGLWFQEKSPVLKTLKVFKFAFFSLDVFASRFCWSNKDVAKSSCSRCLRETSAAAIDSFRVAVWRSSKLAFYWIFCRL